MKTLSVSLALDDKEAELLLTKWTCKELEGLICREAYHVLNSLVNDIKTNIPFVETLEPEVLFND